MLTNRLFGTHPVVVHAHGSHPHKPEWPPIREWFFATARRSLPPLENLTIMTCNNGHPAMGLMERSLEHLGLSCLVAGQGVDPWINSVHKPRAVVEAARRVTTPYLAYVDSRDAIFVDAPHVLVERFETFSCDMVFSADRLNWPQVKAFKKFEDGLEGARESEFRYLNGGVWMGRTAFCLEFFEQALRTEPAAEAPESEQGILKKLLQVHAPRVRLDYRCEMFQNIGFVATPIFSLD